MKAKLTKIFALSDMKEMSYDEFNSVIKQTLDRHDCSNEIVFLDIGEVYGLPDLQSDHAKTLLYQKINARR